LIFFRKHYGALTTGALCVALAPAILLRACLTTVRAMLAGQRRQWDYAVQYWRVTAYVCRLAIGMQ
jgi:hypothetical protein